MRILNSSTNEKEAVTFFQEKSILSKKRVCGFVHKAKLYFGKQFFVNVISSPAKKGTYLYWELICWQSYFLCDLCMNCTLYGLLGRGTDFCEMVSKAFEYLWLYYSILVLIV